MKVLFIIFVIFYVLYVVNKFLGRFYFKKFTNGQHEILDEMLRRQKQYSQSSREGEIKIENLKNKSNKSQNANGGDYVDYEIVK